MAPGNGGDDVLPGQRLSRQVSLHQLFVAEGQGLVPGALLRPEIHKALSQPAAQLVQQGLPAGAGQVHLIDKEEGGDMAPAQQGPQRLGVALHPRRGR